MICTEKRNYLKIKNRLPWRCTYMFFDRTDKAESKFAFLMSNTPRTINLRDYLVGTFTENPNYSIISFSTNIWNSSIIEDRLDTLNRQLIFGYSDYQEICNVFFEAIHKYIKIDKK